MAQDHSTISVPLFSGKMENEEQSQNWQTVRVRTSILVALADGVHTWRWGLNRLLRSPPPAATMIIDDQGTKFTNLAKHREAVSYLPKYLSMASEEVLFRAQRELADLKITFASRLDLVGPLTLYLLDL